MSQQRKPRDLTSKQTSSNSPLNYQLAKNQNGDMLIDKTKKTPVHFFLLKKLLKK